MSTGTPTGPSFRVSTEVTSIAVVGNEIYVARHRSKRGSSGLDVINSATGLGRSWGLIRAEQLAAYGSTLYVVGRTAAEERQGVRARVYSARIGTAKATLKTVSPPLGGTALTLAPQGGRLLVGGTFSSAGGVARANLAAFDVRTGKLLPWRPSVDGVVTGLAAANGKIYIGGYFGHVGGKARRSLAAVTATGAGAAASVAPGPVVLVGCHPCDRPRPRLRRRDLRPRGPEANAREADPVHPPGGVLGFGAGRTDQVRLACAEHGLGRGGSARAESLLFTAARFSSRSLRAWLRSPSTATDGTSCGGGRSAGRSRRSRRAERRSTSAAGSAESAGRRGRTSPPSRSTGRARCSPSRRR